MALADELVKAGFVNDLKGVEYLQGLSAQFKMGVDGPSGGTHTILAFYVKGDKSVTFEQTQAQDKDRDGGSVLRTHPMVCIVEGPELRTAVNPLDTDLVLALVGEPSKHDLAPRVLEARG
jgi:hypothetical protein